MHNTHKSCYEGGLIHCIMLHEYEQQACTYTKSYEYQFLWKELTLLHSENLWPLWVQHDLSEQWIFHKLYWTVYDEKFDFKIFVWSILRHVLRNMQDSAALASNANDLVWFNIRNILPLIPILSFFVFNYSLLSYFFST